ncbi:MAG: undecaprenyldiphospho-muramoylpentapeptide beta-N-acetylglucosaminyltransferase [Deltaproteobacteria bacterium]|nr:undecaprenyldiphospho-muramoylpentapeptide beta-N-acetylglucosaminyltransferase [Deltaproteobacteria bacterium]MBW1977148.1 undecaprenyldiphospho-muramoylpentapeptide beta-N-acetylglucosaminyltransferase [Deltaproteobacteria bacterium]MBW2043595.1 undecaprenyldiphospho-muramoylpentapeptide beta-N-acetylglucosaminyltransferase [Deltaproteobacteria bacterium]MBW2299051.1 undecaprenyldiphospho-muramoylpentapeptide beta-N-acetylglucosaminyltransferase [Deltaproteobacteria bacterium]RLB35941.1 MA
MNEPRDESISVVIAGGGTGGHLFPGLAVAKEIQTRYSAARILFVTGRRRKMETRIITESGFPHASISVEGIKGRGWKKGSLVVMKLPWSLFQSLKIVRKFSPHVVLGVGGYSAGPLLLAAKIMRIPTAIHEQNSFPGLTNRLLCRFVDRVFISFEESSEHFSGGNILLTGNPIRPEVLEGEKPGEKRGDAFTVLVLGGSQGARAINDAFMEALEILNKKGKAPSVIHQTGERDYSRVLAAYEQKGFKVEVSGFIREMGKAYAEADLVVSRAGATTVAELAALGKPSILIPYPYAANRHQETNAGIIAQRGGAEMILEEELSGDRLADAIARYMEDGKALENMAAAAGSAGKPDAAGVIADNLIEMVRHANIR